MCYGSSTLHFNAILHIPHTSHNVQNVYKNIISLAVLPYCLSYTQLQHMMDHLCPRLASQHAACMFCLAGIDMSIRPSNTPNLASRPRDSGCEVWWSRNANDSQPKRKTTGQKVHQKTKKSNKRERHTPQNDFRSMISRPRMFRKDSATLPADPLKLQMPTT